MGCRMHTVENGYQYAVAVFSGLFATSIQLVASCGFAPLTSLPIHNQDGCDKPVRRRFCDRRRDGVPTGRGPGLLSEHRSTQSGTTRRGGREFACPAGERAGASEPAGRERMKRWPACRDRRSTRPYQSISRSALTRAAHCSSVSMVMRRNCLMFNCRGNDVYDAVEMT